MPALNNPTGDIAWEVPVPSPYYPKSVSTQISLAIAFLAVLAAIRFLLRRRRTCQDPASKLGAFDGKHRSTQLSLGTTETKSGQKFGPAFNVRPGPGPPLWADRARGFVPLSVLPSQLGPLRTPAAMEHGEGGLGEDHYPWSALAASRGVSTSSPTPPHDPSHTGPSSFTVTGRTRQSRSPRTSSRVSAGKRLSGSPEGIDGQGLKEIGEGRMARAAGPIGDGLAGLELDGETAITGALVDGNQPYSRALRDASSSFPGADFAVPRNFARPPPPPPLTPPTLSGSFFPFEDRRPSNAASIPPALDMSFIHQPNPEYGGSTSTEVLSSSPQSATAVSRRRSYTSSVPVGIPVPTTTASASSSAETMTSGSTTTSTPFSPSSYPPTSPFLPPPPPGQYDLPPSAPPEYKFVGGPGGPGVFLSQQEIDLHGEIISVMDDAGHGWKRHTRVYGGGVCLACVAAAARDGGQGGFYGDKVPLEDRR